MRLAFISDLHANVPALTAVFDAIDHLSADEVICLGDIVDLGPQPAEVVAMVRERGIACIGGNHDPLDERPAYPLLRDIEAWTEAQLSPDARAWLDALPFSVEREAHGHRLLGVHGSPRLDTENIDPDVPTETLRTMLQSSSHDVLVAGHTHAPLVRRLGRQLVVNCGSVGLAFEEVFRGGPGDPTVLPVAEFATVDLLSRGVSATIHRVPYDVDAYVAAVYASKMPRPEQWLRHRSQ